jgi:ABC-2 type transport system ATP-binding protein
MSLLAELDEPDRLDERQVEFAIQLDQVRRKFGKVQALDGISLAIPAGERVALLGPNGAGKTTLIRAICHRIKIDSGRINLFGRSIDGPNGLDCLGVIPQELAIYGDLTVRENLMAFGKLHRLSKATLRERVDWVLDWIDLGDRQRHLAKNLSGGMKRRINLACGILHRPRIILLDEPTVGVDPQSRQRIFDLLDQLAAEGATLVITTHHLEEAQSQCERIVIIDHGQVIADGPMHGLIEHTTGTARQIYLQIDGNLLGSVPNLDWDEVRQCFVATVADPANELPYLLHRIKVAGGRVIDLEMHQPNLHDVFLHLTGRELRE